MIALTNDQTNFPAIDGAVVVNKLEAMTGADMLISPLEIPASKTALIREHLQHGAMLIQVKFGLDLAASVGERLANSLIKMREVAPTQAQRVLLFIGTLACDADDRAIIDGRKVDQAVPGVNYWACQTSLEAWGERGGLPLQLSRRGLLAEWCKRKEQRLKKYLENPVEYFYPDKPELFDGSDNDPLQIPVRVNDWRVMVATAIGPKTAQRLYEASEGNGAMALDYLCDPDVISGKRETVAGVGVGVVKKWQARMNMQGHRLVWEGNHHGKSKK